MTFIKKLVLATVIILGTVITASAQDKLVDVTYKDGIEYKTETYDTTDGYSIKDLYRQGRFISSTRSKDGIVVTLSANTHKAYGKYVAFNMIITNKSGQRINFIPSEHATGVLFDKKGRANKPLTYAEYQKIVKRRQNGNAFAMALLTGIAAAGNGYSSGTGYGNVGGTSYSYSYTSYNSLQASIENQRDAQNLANFIDAQSEAFQVAKNSYLKANTIENGQTVGGHILLPQKGLSKKDMTLKIDILVGGVMFNFKKRFVKR